MYIRTKECFGLERKPWSDPQNSNQPTVQPSSIGYLSSIDEYLGKDEKKSCERRFIVEFFARGSAKTTTVIRKDIKDIANNIIGLLERKLRPLKAKKDVALSLHCEGHVDKGTDPKQFGKLDLERAGEVGYLLSKSIGDRWNAMQFGGLTIHNTYSAAGISRPVSNTSGKNRRVELCMRIKIDPYVSP